jgi:hypothetical protein
MNRNTKIILGILGGLLGVCLCLSVAGFLVFRNLENSLIVDDPAEISALAGEIADYTLPPGYREEGVINFIFGKMLMITAGEPSSRNARPVIMFMQLPEEFLADEAELQAQSELGIQQALGSGDYDLAYVGEQNAIIREENVTLFIYEGVDENGTPIRQIISEVFAGKAGPTILFVIGPIRHWDQPEINAFVRSLR